MDCQSIGSSAPCRRSGYAREWRNTLQRTALVAIMEVAQANREENQMTFGDLSDWTIALGAKEKPSYEVRQRVSRELPSFVRAIDPRTAPKRVKLPSGESLTDATRMTAIKCHSLLLARKVHGSGYVKVAADYEALAKDLLFWVMRHNFNTGDPKGARSSTPCSRMQHDETRVWPGNS
jgi:hypothetical protein